MVDLPAPERPVNQTVQPLNPPELLYCKSTGLVDVRYFEIQIFVNIPYANII